MHLPRAASIRWTAPLAAALSLVLAASPVAAATPVPDAVRTLYDPSIVRDFRIDLMPLAGWASAEDWIAPEGWTAPEGWDVMTAAERDAVVAADPVLRPLAVTAAWDVVRFDTTNSIVLPATFVEVVDGSADQGWLVGVRRKSSRALPSEADPRKVGLKVGFTDFVSGQTFRGVTKLSLENAGDVSPLYEGLAWQLHQLASAAGFYGAGYDPALAAWATVTVNGESLGVYTSVEQRNKQFLRNRGLWTSGSSWLYEQDDIGLPSIDQGPAPLPDGTEVHSPQYGALCFVPFQTAASASCAIPSDADLRALLPTLIDMDAMLTQGAVDAITGNPDALFSHGKNFHWADKAGELRRYYPWDLDAVFRAVNASVYAESSSTNRRGVTSWVQNDWQRVILNHGDFRARYNALLAGLLAADGPLGAAALDALFARIRPALEEAMAADPYVPAVVSIPLDEHFAQTRAWLETRRTNILGQIALNLPAPRNIQRDATALAYAGATTARTGAAVTLVAALTGRDGVPLAGRTVTFVVNKVAVTAVTDGEGIARATGKAPTKTGTYAVTASFGGDALNAPSSVSASLVVTR